MPTDLSFEQAAAARKQEAEARQRELADYRNNVAREQGRAAQQAVGEIVRNYKDARAKQSGSYSQQGGNASTPRSSGPDCSIM